MRWSFFSLTGAVVLWVGFTARFFAAPMAWAQGAAGLPEGSGEQAGVEEPQKKEFSEEVTVVASPILEGESLSVFGSPLVTVTSRQIEDLGAVDLASALRWVPGVTISRYNLVGSYGGGDGGAIFLRGHGSGRPGAEILTAFDGVPLFVGVWTHPLLDLLPTDLAEKIEVYKSPQPVLLGNMAFAACNIVPKRAGKPGAVGRLSGHLGEHGTLGGVLEWGFGEAKRDGYFVLAQRKSEGHRPNADGSVSSMFGRLSYSLMPGWEAELEVLSSDSWAHDPGELGAPVPAVIPKFAVKNTLVIAKLLERRGNREGEVKVFWSDGDIRWRQWDSRKQAAFITLTDFHNQGVQLQESFELPKNTVVRFGLEYQRYGGAVVERRTGSKFSFSESNIGTTSLYALAARTFGGKLAITPSAGVRWLNAGALGSHWTGQLGLVGQQGPWETYVNAARAINLPGIYAAVLYRQWGQERSWEELEPETLRHLEIGVARKLAPGSELRLAALRDRVLGAIRFVPPPPPPPFFANLGKYSLEGVELTTTLQLLPGMVGLFGGTYLRANPENVPNAPRWFWVAGASWMPSPRLRVNLDAEWVDRHAVLNPRFASQQRWVDKYLLLNAKASYTLPLGGDAASRVWVAAENLTDESYEYRPGYPAPGRTLTAGVEVRF